MLTLRRSHYSKLKNHLINVAEIITGFKKLSKLHDRALTYINENFNFWQAATKALQVKVIVSENDLNKIPQKGPLLIIANHPFGGIEAITLAAKLSEVRQDFMFIANAALNAIPEVAPYLFSVDIDESRGLSTKIQNRLQIQNAIHHLKAEGALILFPAGEVSTAFPPWRKAYDKRWSRSVARIAKESKAQVLPIYFKGKNSFLFQLVSVFLFENPSNFLTRILRKISLGVRGLLMVFEVLRHRQQNIDMHIGATISYDQFKHIESNRSLAEYFRIRTYLLGGDAQLINSRLDFIQKRIKKNKPVKPRKLLPVGLEIDKALLREDLINLNPQSLVYETNDFRVYIANYENIPNIVAEIGRLREITFRAEGEGSGLAYDLDKYDKHYEHIFIWHKANDELVGAYRLGMVSNIMEKIGIEGIYTHSLFKYDIKFLDQIGEAMELGRSFIVPKHQGSQALSILLTGIAKILLQRPQIKSLFGPASISAEYSKLASFIMIEYLMKHHGAEDKMQSMVKPYLPYKLRTDLSEQNLNELLHGAHNLDGLNAVVETLEGEKNVPTLITYYSKMGAKYVAFSVDKEFNSIDGLIVVKLSEFPKPMMRRMLKDKTDQFYEDRKN
ncbi:MAG: lysophospholipid acyltransferase family protein [Bdellovibrionales bacterium]|nr:lysophospholipid acyltransferase family protein [Bdellovibrionales bacterium]